jgi:uncharacterized membrane protein YozB (DUF420 family)
VDLSFLPLLNAILNAIALLLLLVGLYFIKQKKWQAHRNCMLSAFAVSSLFLVFYLTHKAWRASTGKGLHTEFNGTGLVKLAYQLMLLSHVLLAMAVPVLAIWLIVLGMKRSDDKHRRLARIALPIWIYVSLTGVLVYVVLYHLNPSA